MPKGKQNTTNNAATTHTNTTTELYKYWNTYWNTEYWQGQIQENEAYFKYFNYPDFVTPHSGLNQIKKYAEHY